MSPCEDLTVTDRCFHSFCFVCIRQWTSINPCCPLCKTGYDSLIRRYDPHSNTYQRLPIHQRAPEGRGPSATAQSARAKRRVVYSKGLKAVLQNVDLAPLELVLYKNVKPKTPYFRTKTNDSGSKRANQTGTHI
uniref:RING-type E3 ubiquitin transferase n=1 Tax=Arcella intermedia TaxID=1963864 RepID=A0A6B2LPN1_9EUKA